MSQRNKFQILFPVLATALLAAGAVGCGGSDQGGHGGSSQAKANEVDQSFVRLMVPHHESAIGMATLAASKGQHKQVKTLAVNITATQNAEIDQMKGVASTIGVDVGGGSGMSGMDHGAPHAMGDAADLKTLGLTRAQAGMSMDMTKLESAKPFDRAFIDMMVPHHQGAVRMAQEELAQGENSSLKSIARKIVGAQQGEINEMNSWRTSWYGGPVRGSG